jgi:hypothetical protein
MRATSSGLLSETDMESSGKWEFDKSRRERVLVSR